MSNNGDNWKAAFPKADWEHEDVLLYCRDCLDILPQLPAGCVDCVVTDPPYGILDLGWDAGLPSQCVLDECLRVAPGPVVWFGPASKLLEFAGYSPPPERVFVWAPRFTLGQSRSPSGVFYRWHPIVIWREPTAQAAIRWDILDVACEGHRGWNHPATKPLELMRHLVEYGNGGTLDPFMGSGTTGVACIQTGRRFVGIEIEPKYFDIAVRRIEAAIADDETRFDFAKAKAPDPQMELIPDER